MNPLISVVIPTYNRAALIKKAIDSVLMQTYKNWEIIVSDDGSTDNTAELLAPMSKADSRIRYIRHEPNQGAQTARNNGVKAAKGEWIAFLDSDDQWFPESLELRINIAKCENVSVVHSEMYIKHHNEPLKYYYVPAWSGNVYRRILTREGPVFPALLVKKEALQRIGYLDPKIKSFQEWDTYIRLAKHYYFGFEPKPTFIYDYTTENAISRSDLRAGQGYEQVFSKHFWEIFFYAGPKILGYHYTVAANWYEKAGDQKNTKRCRIRALVWKVLSPTMIFRKLRQVVQEGWHKNKAAISKTSVYGKAAGLKRTVTRVNIRGIILMYHRVADVDFDAFQLSVSPAHFEEHMQVIKKYGQPLPMQEMGKNLRKFSLGSKEIVVTFDDGYTDNFHNAKPILEQENVPATFFITTGAINSNEEFYWHSLERCLLAPEILPETLEVVIANKKYSWRIKPEGPCRMIDYNDAYIQLPQNGTMLSRSQLYFSLNPMLSCEPADIRKQIVKQIAEGLGQSLAPRPDYLAMTSEELRSLAQGRLFEIGAHTIRHPALSRLASLDQEKEIKDSKLFLEETLGRAVNSFSYPFGDYSSETHQIVKRLNFKNACTVAQGSVNRSMDPYLLSRFSVLNWNKDQFEEKLRYWLSN